MKFINVCIHSNSPILRFPSFRGSSRFDQCFLRSSVPEKHVPQVINSQQPKPTKTTTCQHNLNRKRHFYNIELQTNNNNKTNQPTNQPNNKQRQQGSQENPPKNNNTQENMNHWLICFSLFRTERHNERRRQKAIHHQQRQTQQRRKSQSQRQRSRMRISRVRQPQQIDHQQIDQQHTQKLDLCEVTTTSMARRMDMEQLERDFDDDVCGGRSHNSNNNDDSHPHRHSSTTNLSSSLRSSSSSQYYSSSPSPISILRISSTDLSLFY